jgi:gamma-glutamylcysteine synthetase
MLEQRAKKYIELRGDCVEKNPSLVAVACFLVGLKTYQHPLVHCVGRT